MSVPRSSSSSVPAPFSPRLLSGVSFQRDYYVHGIASAKSQNKTERVEPFSLPLSSCFFWTDGQDDGQAFLMFALFFSAWFGSFTDTPTPHKGRPRFRLFFFSFCLFSTPCQSANAPALFSLPTSHYSLWLIGLFHKRPSCTKAYTMLP